MRRRSCTTSICAVDSPFSKMVPEEGSTSRLIIRNEVVFPQPDGPTSTVIFPPGATEVQAIHHDGAVVIMLGHIIESNHRYALWSSCAAKEQGRVTGRMYILVCTTCKAMCHNVIATIMHSNKKSIKT